VLTWQLVLEAVWSDKSKRLIPILLKDAPLPPFVLSAFKLSSMDGADLPIVRVRNPRQATETAQTVIQIIRGEITHSQISLAKVARKVRLWGDSEVRETRPRSGPGKSASRNRLSVSLESSANADASTKAGYSVRLDEIERVAKRLKH